MNLLNKLAQTVSNFFLPNLIITSGSTQTLPARIYRFNRIDIQTGGILKILEQNSQWLVFDARSVIINGSIIYTKFTSNPSTFTVRAPDGTNLEHTNTQISLGGNGGNGGYGKNARPGDSIQGGSGAQGAITYGGGGGSGGVMYDGGKLETGNSGNGPTGGPFKGQFDGAGGNGGKLGDWSNGGLIYIYCRTDFDGQGGIIDVRGEKGEDGKRGADGRAGAGAFDYGSGGGGGGGGAPGGNGGIIKIRVRGDVIAYPQTLVNGGIGGTGASGGSAGASGFRNGNPGNNGQDGQNGFVDFLD